MRKRYNKWISIITLLSMLNLWAGVQGVMANEGDAGHNQPPVIQHTPVSQGNENEDLLITANITDPDDSVTAAVYYKTASQTASQSAFTAIPMTEESDAGNYSAVIQKEAITEPELQYYIQANDAANTVKTDTYTVAIEPSSFDYSKVPALLITELVPDSSNFAGADAYEFIEIYNNTNRPIALKDYQILYRYTDNSRDDAVWEIPSEAVIPPMQTMVFWIMNGKNNSLTVADFNANYGTSLAENTEIVRVNGGGGMANGGQRKIVIASKAGVEVSEAYYDNDDQTVPDKGIFYQYPIDGSNQMRLYSAGKEKATPGRVESFQVPPQPAPPVNQLPVIEHTPVTTGSVDHDLLVNARIIDPDGGNVTAAVYYKTAGAADFQSVVMMAGADNEYSASIPRQALTGAELQYFIQAHDGTDTVKTDTYTVQIQTGDVDYSKLPPLLVTELVPDSTNVGSADGYEFIEIYNNTDKTINFKNYKIVYRYTDSGPDADVVWPTDEEEILIPSRKTLVFWVINGQNTEKTVADFNALYGTNLVEGVDIVKIYSDGMANGGKRGIVIATNTGTEISAAYYDNDAETVPNKGIFYKYDPTGSTKMVKYSAGTEAATPGRVEPIQVPAQPVSVPEDTIDPTFRNLTDVEEIDQSRDLEIVAEAQDENRVKSVALFYKNDRQTEFTKRYMVKNFGDTYNYIVYAPELIGRSYIEYYFAISDGQNEITTETYRIKITGGMDRSNLRLNVKDGDIISGTWVLKGTSQYAPPSELQLSVDGKVLEDGAYYTALEQDAYFAFDVKGVNLYFKNAVTIGDEILHTFDDTINKYTTITVPIQADRLKSGSNVISIRAGTKASPFDDRPEENKDDFDIKNVRLVLSDGTELYDARYNNPDTVIKMGDSVGRYPFIDFEFVIPPEKMISRAYAWDTRQVADGEHTITVSHKDYGTKTARIQIDNTAPVIAPNLEEGKVYRGAFTIDASVHDALAGVERVEAWLDEEPIRLPYVTSSSQLAPGDHLLIVSATDKVGNNARKEVHFKTPDEIPAKPELVSPASGQTGVGRNAVLTVKVTDPTNDTLKVSFFRGFKYDAATKGNFSGFRNAVDVEPPQQKIPDGEQPFTKEDYERIRAADGIYLTDDAVEQFPYHRFQVQLDDSVKATDLIKLSWKGNSLEGRKVSMYVWSPAKQQWTVVDQKVAGTEDFELGAWITAGEFAEDRTIQVLVQDELPANQDSFDFSFVWMSDTQYYSESYPYIFEDIVNWIADNKEGQKIKYVIHTGDIVDEADKPIQWQRADANMKLLEEAGIPYGVLAGNHDVSHKLEAYDDYWQYFGEDRFKNQPTFGGSIDNNRGHYDLVSSNGNDFIIVYMGWGIRDSDIEWMNKVLAQYPERKAILCFHEYLLVSGNRAPIGDKIFEQVVKKNKNVFAVLSGHYHDAELLVDEIDDDGDGVADRNVYQMLADYQAGPEGGQGYIRLLQFDVDNNKLHVKTYSPYLDRYNFYDPAEYPGKDEFSLDVDLQPQTKRLATDYMSVQVYTDQLIGSVDQVASGQKASVTWRNLDAHSSYEWYAMAEDAYSGKSMSDIWTFTTGSTDSSSDHRSDNSSGSGDSSDSGDSSEPTEPIGPPASDPVPQPEKDANDVPMIPEQDVTFKDIPSNFWAYSEIQQLSKAGILKGKPDGRIDPNGKVTRGQFALILYRALNLQAESHSFPDVPKQGELAEAVGAIIGAGIAKGYANGKFGPNDPITRGQMAIMVTKAMGLQDEVEKAKTKPWPYSDSVYKGHRNYAIVMQEHGIITGSNGQFKGGSHATRAQAAVIIIRMLEKM